MIGVDGKKDAASGGSLVVQDMEHRAATPSYIVGVCNFDGPCVSVLSRVRGMTVRLG